jgi:hypothetical protein
MLDFGAIILMTAAEDRVPPLAGYSPRIPWIISCSTLASTQLRMGVQGWHAQRMASTQLRMGEQGWHAQRMTSQLHFSFRYRIEMSVGTLLVIEVVILLLKKSRHKVAIMCNRIKKLFRWKKQTFPQRG